MGFLRALFIWWNNATIGTVINTWLHGVTVGADAFGNRYYQSRDGKRRWALYAGTVEASRTPPEWNSWLRFTIDQPPAAGRKRRPWEKDHLPNLSGTEGAYHPPGSLVRGEPRAPTTGDYESWSPNA
ncbi:MAG TPA: NADH:ubiquinone oxidoreductase subunit NDUFA12 [Rhizomicrobium sp.]|nr:NADH:ubiquinone oxidoreductase subunit NDUFA12 [Rhizomicrobium sp.]